MDNHTAYFISGTGTGVGKTFVTRALARVAARRGARVSALKPIETGCDGDPLDARAIAAAARRPELAAASGLYRAAPPVAPLAATLLGHPPVDVPALVARVNALAADADVVLVEGAGGLLVPLDRRRTVAELAAGLRLRLVLVAVDRLGVLSDVLCYAEAVVARSLTLAAVVLNRADAHGTAAEVDVSPMHNRAILATRLACPVIAFPHCRDADDALADAAVGCGLADALLPEQVTKA